MNLIVFAFLSGILGAMIGGTASFVVTGMVGVFTILLSSLQVDISLINDQVLNFLFMPCICFNGAAAAMAFAANVRHHPMNGADGNRSLYFTGDPWVLLIGGLFGVVGYLFYSIFVYFNLPLDIGALVVTTVNILIRFLFGTKKYIHHLEHPLFSRRYLSFWIFQIIFAGAVGLVAAYFVGITKIASLGFSISAVTLIFAFSNPEFPATHHITLVAGYAMMVTNSYLISMIFAILSQVIFIAFTNYFNTDLDSHVDGPAVAIASLSLILFTFF